MIDKFDRIGGINAISVDVTQQLDVILCQN